MVNNILRRGRVREGFKEEAGLSKVSVQLNSHSVSIFLHFMPNLVAKEPKNR